jgi:hypothetical protein
MTRKKDWARHRARPARHPPNWFDGEIDLEPEHLIFHRLDLDCDQHGPQPRPLCQLRQRWAPADGPPPWSLQDHHVGAGLRMTGMVAPMVLDGPINGNSFEAYVGPGSRARVRPGDVIVIDNPSSELLRIPRPGSD